MEIFHPSLKISSITKIMMYWHDYWLDIAIRCEIYVLHTSIYNPGIVFHEFNFQMSTGSLLLFSKLVSKIIVKW